VGTYRIHLDANRSAVRALGAAHQCPELGGSWIGKASSRTEGQELPVPVEPPVE
jgi:hypothetical protein